jgi:membrane protease YdiL (CAAX protease family)
MPLAAALVTLGGTAVVAVAAYLQYGPAVTVSEWFARRVAPRLPQAADHPLDHVRSVVNLVFFGAAGLLVYSVLTLAAGLSPLQPLGLAATTPALLLLGAGLGLVEAATAFLFASTGIAVWATVRYAQNGAEAALELQTVGRSGWIRVFDHVLRMLPPPLALGLVVLPITAEELLFRALGVSLLRPAGPVVAIAATTLIFTAAQRAGMPSWLTAMPAMCSGILLGVTHAYLYWLVPSIAPLIVAHLVFFLFVAWW